MSKNSETCPYYKQGLFIGSRPNGDSEISMCCYQKKKPVTTADFFHPHLEDIRRRSVTERPAECIEECWIPGHRRNQRELSLTADCWDESSTEIRRLHLEQSLACNLTCITCSTRFSSGWNRDYHLFEPDAPKVRLKKNVRSVWKDLDLSTVREINFTGGEPLMNPDNLEILRHLDSIGTLSQVGLSYNTNGTIIPNAEFLSYWKKCRWVRLFFSFDGVHSVFEYTRYPAKWEDIIGTVKYMQSLKDICIMIEVNAVVGIHNLFNLPDFYKWYTQNALTGSQGDPSAIWVRNIDGFSHGARVLDVKYLPRSLYQPAVDMLQSLSQLPGASNLIPLLSKEENNSWIDYLNRLDAIRGTSWKQSLPGQLIGYDD